MVNIAEIKYLLRKVEIIAPEVKLSEGQNVNKIYFQIQPLNVISTLVVVPTTDKAIYF
jgi:hypothetical protein